AEALPPCVWLFQVLLGHRARAPLKKFAAAAGNNPSKERFGPSGVSGEKNTSKNGSADLPARATLANMAVDRKSFNAIIRQALTSNGVDPDGTGPVPFEKMTAIARDARAALNRLSPSQDDVHNC